MLWSREYLEAVISDAKSRADRVEVGGPPGAGKTRSVIEWIVESRVESLLFFPTHENAFTALRYIVSGYEARGYTRPPHHILYYAGARNFCILATREGVEALGELADDELSYYVYEALSSGTPLEDVARIVGWRTLCTRVCPLAKLLRGHREDAAKILSKPAVIVPRFVAERLNTRLEVVVVDPRESLRGNTPPLCPRLLLLAPLARQTGSNRYTFLAAKPLTILAPHAAMNFILSVYKMVESVTGVKKRPFIFIDEYDALLREEVHPLLTLDDIDEYIAALDAVSRDEPDYVKKYASSLERVAKHVANVVKRSLEAGEYHSLVALFAEGAETQLVDGGVTYKPFSARVVSIKHFKDGALHKLLESIGEDLEPEERRYARLRIAAGLSAARTARRVLRVSKLLVATEAGLTPVHELRYTRVYGRPVDPVAAVRWLLAPLSDAPRYTLYYVVRRGVVYAARLPRLPMVENAVFSSATLIDWSVYLAGVNIGQVGDIRVAAAASTMHSTTLVASVKREEYASRFERSYVLVDSVYAESPRLDGDKLRYRTARRVVRVVQIEPVTSALREYTSRLRVVLARLPPLGGPIPVADALRPYLRVLGELRSRGTVLVLAQNKRVARLLARLAGCRSVTDKRGKILYYECDNVIIAWFRSRAARGIDLPARIDYVLVVGSSYSPPTVLAPAATTASALSIPVRSHAGTLYVTTTPRDVARSIAELAQALGRALRDAARRGRTIPVILPVFLARQVLAYGPHWLRLAIRASIGAQ